MSNGIGFMQARRWSQFRHAWVRIPSAKESSHLLIMGDTGSGKSVLIRQILLQIEAREEPAIVYDPTGEFVTQFYDPDRGDVIMNPLDARCCYWSPADEIRIDAEAMTLAQSLYPVKPMENSFFADAPQRIMSAILAHRTGPEAIIRLLSNPDEVDRMVKGTPVAAMIDPKAGPQRAGVLASLNMVAEALMLLPSRRATSQCWSATEWSTHRQGWVFFTSTPQTRARLVPLTSLWLDLLVLRMMNQALDEPAPAKGQRAWFVIDELASLQRLPQLHTAMTEARKSRCPLVLACQGHNQIEQRYGTDAKVMLSQPATKIFLRTSEPESAKWISQTIGEVQIDRLRPSRSSSDGWATTSRNGLNWALETHVEPLVLPSEIQGMPDLTAVLKFENLVTNMRLAYVKPPARQPSYIPRPDVATAGTPVYDVRVEAPRRVPEDQTIEIATDMVPEPW